MSKTITELLNGGVVTARIGALLDSGELQRADDCIYRLNDPALWRAPGRTVYNSAVLGAPSMVKGLMYTEWNDQSAQVLSAVGTSLYRSPFTGVTGSFTEMSSPGKVAGTVSASTTFTASGGLFPFTADVVGARVYVPTSISTSAVNVTATSGAADASGRFAAIVVSQTITGATSIGLDWGVAPQLARNNSGEVTTTVLGGTRWGNTYFTQNGFNSAQRVAWRKRAYSGGSELAATLVTRPVGLAPVVGTGFALSTTTGTWTSLLATGYFWFLVTEIYAPGGNVVDAEKDPYLKAEIIESAYLAEATTTGDPNGNAGRPLAVSLTSGGTTVPVITFPAIVNDGQDGRLATNWGIYMYGPTTLNTDPPALSLFRRVATPSIFATTYTLTETTTAPQLKYPGTAAAGFGGTILTNSSRILGITDNTWTGTDALFSLIGGDTSGKAVLLTNWGFTVTTPYDVASIVGIEVGVRCRATTSDNVFPVVQVSTSGGKTGILYTHASGGLVSQLASTKKFGGPTDTMGAGLVAGDISTIRVSVGIGGSGALSFDSVYLKLYYTGGIINLNGPAYRVVTYRDQIGIAIDDPANLLPPVPTTMDTFQGSLVMNDPTTDGALRFSLPGRPEAFPRPYVLDFDEHKINYIGRLGSALIVGFQSAIKRVNYLPRETDTDLTSGLVHEDVTTDHGIPGPFCAARLHIPGRQMMLAYVSTTGIFLTNGIWTVPLNTGLDWAATVKLTALSTAVLRVYPREQLLALYYCPSGATHSLNTRALYFSYQADKLKGLQMPAVGPVVVSGRSSCEANIDGTHYLLTGHEANGTVYVEDSGVAIPTGYQVTLTATSSTQGDGRAAAGVDVKIIPFVRTRKFYPVTMDRDGFGEKVYLMFSSYGTNSVTASSTTVAASTTVTSSAAFGSVVAGMRVLGTGIDPGTIVVSKSDSSTIVISRAANTSGTATLTFDTGTLGIGIRGSGLGEAVKGLSTNYVSSLAGDLVSLVSTNFRRGFELQVEKVPLTFDSNGDTLTWADLGVNMRLHSISYVLTDAGLPDSNRNAA